ncbi:MAG: hypothetical protein J1E65_03840 [Lachnospiraceae bacterium]|nr:hypothetical protein [Lachnospiraceae bacterium]
MKKRAFITLSLTVLLGVSACGTGTPSVPPLEVGDYPANTAPVEETDTTEETEETNIEEEIVEEDLPEETVEEEPGIDTWNLDYDNTFHGEWGKTAWIDAIPLVEEPESARYIVHFVAPDKSIISVTWVGPVGLGGDGGISRDKSTFMFSTEDLNYRFETWGGRLIKGDYLLKDLNPVTIMEDWDAVEDSFTVVEDSETIYIVRFEAAYVSDGISYRGYTYFIDYLDRMEEYLFAYLVEESLFNEEEAMAVVNSIEYYEEEK